MTKEEALRRALVLKAYADGKDVQHSWHGDPAFWIDNKFPVFDWNHYNYRVKPKTIKYRNYFSTEFEDHFVRTATARDEKEVSALNLLPVKWIGDWQEVEV